MTDDNEVWRSGQCVVTAERLQTRRMTVALSDIDLVELRRPLLGAGAVFAAASTALAFRFGDVLYSSELTTLLGLGWASFALSCVIARLKLHSYSIDGVAVTLPIWTATAMRRAIDEARPTKRRPRTKRKWTTA